MCECCECRHVVTSVESIVIMPFHLSIFPPPVLLHLPRTNNGQSTSHVSTKYSIYNAIYNNYSFKTSWSVLFELAINCDEGLCLRFFRVTVVSLYNNDLLVFRRSIFSISRRSSSVFLQPPPPCSLSLIASEKHHSDQASHDKYYKPLLWSWTDCSLNTNK